jgi:hypothetical protein
MTDLERDIKKITNPSILDVLAKKGDSDMMLFVAKNKFASSMTLSDLLCEPRVSNEVYEHIALNQNTYISTLNQLKFSDSIAVLMNLLKNTSSPIDIIEYLTKHKSMKVSSAAKSKIRRINKKQDENFAKWRESIA